MSQGPATLRDHMYTQDNHRSLGHLIEQKRISKQRLQLAILGFQLFMNNLLNLLLSCKYRLVINFHRKSSVKHSNKTSNSLIAKCKPLKFCPK